MKKNAISFAVILFLLPLSLHCQVLLGPWLPSVSEKGFTVNWETDVPCIVRLDVIESGKSDTLSFWSTRYGRSLTGTAHSVTAEGLNPGTSYSYRVCSREVVDESHPYQLVYKDTESESEWYDVVTLDRGAGCCRFSMVNDIHGDKELFSTLFSDAPEMDFVLLNGDMVSYMTSIGTVKDQIVNPISDLLHSTPMFYVRGNHEGRGQEFFRFEEVSPSRDGKAWYAFRQGPVAFVVVDCGEDKPDSHPAYCGNAHFDSYRAEEAAWIASVTKEKWFRSAPVKICVSHIPMFVEEDSWYTQKQLHDIFLPVLNRAGIDLMLSGHFHSHGFAPAGHSGNDFPVLVNDCDERLDFYCDGKTMDIRIYDRDGNLAHTFVFKNGKLFQHQ